MPTFLINWVLGHVFARQERIFCMMDYRWFRVRYQDGEASIRMPLGNAEDYKEIFGGTIEWAGFDDD